MKKSSVNYLMALLCLVILGGISAYSSTQIQKSKQQVLRHVVAFQFKEDITEERRAQAIKDFLDLKDEIPEIIKFEGGENISVEGLDKGLTHCFILTFESAAARDAYLPHPAHIRVAEKNKPLMSNLVVLDCWGED
ncbi:MAG: Dabb family protein [Bacteroidota bacterium]